MIDIYTDGSCKGNPGPGGWACLIAGDGLRRALSGRDPRTTNNRMELTAALQGLKGTPPGSHVAVHSDSEYLVRTMTRGWQRNANKDLWDGLDAEAAGRQVTWHWVRGHAGHPENEFVNALAEFEAGVRGERPALEGFLGHQQAGAPQEQQGGGLSHLDAQGRARMVDVGAKPETEREATASGTVAMQPQTLALLERGGIEKGDVLATARLAGIMGAKQTSSLVPLCHPIPLTHVDLSFQVDRQRSAIHVTATARTVARTGVEMEAMTAVAVAALTVYDMCKAVDRGIRIEAIRLLRKSGGKSGTTVLE